MPDTPRDQGVEREESSSESVPSTDSWPVVGGGKDLASTDGYAIPPDSTPTGLRGDGEAPSTASWGGPKAQPFDAGRKLGRYTLRRVLGRGGMGIVYEAWDPDQKRAVALKTLNVTDRAADGTLVERFMREARAAARLRHPGIVTILDVDEDQGRHFFTMEYIDGRSFEKCLRSPEAGVEFPLRRRVEILAQVAEALGHAHRAGVIHRDVKPSNVLIGSDGRARLTDFGLAGEVISTDLERLTLAGVVLGTPQYISPEQASGGSRRAVPASDVYSLGVVLFRAITGRLPFEGEGPQAIEAAVRGVAPWPHELNPHVPAPLEAIVMKCLSKDPQLRYRDGDGLAADLHRFLEGRPIEATAPRRESPKERSGKGLPILAVAGVLVLVVGAVALVAGLAAKARNAPGPAAPPPTNAATTNRSPLPENPDLGPAHGNDSTAKAIQARATAEQARRASSAGKLPSTWAASLASARDAARAALRRAPGLAHAHAALGEAATAEGDFPAAAAEFLDALRADPSDVRARFGYAWAAYWSSVFDVLLDIFLDGRADTPRAQTLRHAAAESLARVDVQALPAPERRLAPALLAAARGDEAALGRAVEAAAKEPGENTAGAAFMLLKGSMGIGAARRDPWLQAAVNWPQDPLARALGALTLDLNVNGDEMLAYLHQALEWLPRLAPAHLGRALALQRAGRSEEARAAFAAAIEAWPSDGAARTLRGEFLADQGDTPGAFVDFIAALRIDATRPATFLARGDLRASKGDWTAALADYDSAAALQPGRAPVLKRRTEALLHVHDWRAALAAADEQLAADSEDAAAWVARGQAHAGLGDEDAAVADFSRATDIAPAAPEAWEQRGLAHFRLGLWKEALVDFDKLANRRRLDPRSLRTRGACRRHTGDLPGAEADLLSATLDDPSSAMGWLELARVLALKGDRAGTAAAAKKALEHAPAGWADLEEAKKLAEGP